MAEESKSDRRVHLRAPIELKVQYRKLNSFFSDYTKNLSKGGIFIKTPKPLPIGTRFLFKLSIPTRLEPFEIPGEVRWSNSEGEEQGMGIEFAYTDEAQRIEFEAMVERMMVDKLGRELVEKLLGKPLDTP
jgi:type IV pilus assembly protein PilZ